MHLTRLSMELSIIMGLSMESLSRPLNVVVRQTSGYRICLRFVWPVAHSEQYTVEAFQQYIHCESKNHQQVLMVQNGFLNQLSAK